MQSAAPSEPEGDLGRVLESDRFGTHNKKRKQADYRARKARDAARARRRLIVVMGANLIITAIEIVGAITSGGMALWANAINGIGVAVLLGINWYGLGHEMNGRPKRAATIARWSDIGLIVGYAAIVAWAVWRLIGEQQQHPDGTIVLVVAAIAIAVNSTAARACPTTSSNGKSARLKMFADAAIAAATVIDGLVLMYTGLWRVDAIVTICIGMSVIALAAANLVAKPTNRRH